MVVDRGPRLPGLRIGTVRVRVTLLATALVALALLAASIGLVSTQRRLLSTGIDEALRQRADNIVPTIGANARNVVLPVEGDRQDSFVQLLDDRGRVVTASNNARALPAVVRPLAAGSRARLSKTAHLRAKSHDYRVNESVDILTSSLARFVPIVVALLAFLVWWLTGRVLRPVEAIRSEVAIIEGSKLDRRVPVPASNDEIARLARTMNAMLDRIEGSSIRQQSFIADASHELRSPLTRIRAQLEVGLAHPTTDDPTATYSSLLADAIELQQLIDDLLLAARSDAEASAPSGAAVDLDDLVLVEARRLRGRGRVQVDTSRVSAARVMGDASQLARVIRNLADNAELHATTGVAFEARETGGTSKVIVTDDGPGIPVEHRARVFERFTRLDEARSRDRGGSGLGLAIAQEIVARHRGSIAITASDTGGARFVVTLPRAE